ncbi:MAG: serine hydrolase [Nitrospirae bacterium]|nr:serine hydrolase [Nitrospirota bacterium]
MKFSEQKIGLVAWMLFVFLSGMLLGWVIKGTWDSDQKSQPAKMEIHEGQFEFINPLLECEDGGDAIRRELVPFKEKVEKLLQRKIEAKTADSVSVYFRDLNNGPWFGIKEREFFIPASLLKVPILMAYLKEAESNPKILNKKIPYTGENYSDNERENLMAGVEAEFGKTYTVDELLSLMIVYSDNNSTLLLSNSGWSITKKIYETMGLPLPNLVKGEYSITVKAYASFFRILYNASYLNKGMSNKALDLLASSDFRRGIVAGVPAELKIAHKFGEREVENQRQFHDCGIVYYPGHPYLLCVMTRGDDLNKLIPVVEDISRLTYEEVDRQIRH